MGPAEPIAEDIPLEQIEVVNPRIRNRKIFDEIVKSIAAVGLKKPVTVARRSSSGLPRYDLVCGQGRLEAYRALGQLTIPAIIVDASSEDCMVMSLVENIARRQHRAIDLLHDIGGMKRRGYDEIDIAAKTGLTIEYVRGVSQLLECGEHRLLSAVESGNIPLTVAVQIAEADDVEVQQVLHEAYDRKLLRGKKLTTAKHLIAQRQRRGKSFRTGARRSLSVERLLKTYQDDADKKRALVKKAEITRGRLMFVTEALRNLLADDHFVTLLRAEGLDTLPSNLATRLADN
jgi:ParB family transcriptional regulator, chromosome partitioning protein